MQNRWRKAAQPTCRKNFPWRRRTHWKELGIRGTDWQALTAITPESLFSEIGGMAEESAQGPLQAATSVIAVLLLCALCNGMKLSLGDKPLGGVIGMVGALCVCTTVVRAGSGVYRTCSTGRTGCGGLPAGLCAGTGGNHAGGGTAGFCWFLQSTDDGGGQCDFDSIRQHFGPRIEHLSGPFHRFRHLPGGKLGRYLQRLS